MLVFAFFFFFGIPPLPDASANFYRFTNDFLFSFESRLNVECRHRHHLPRKKGSVKEGKKEREETDGVRKRGKKRCRLKKVKKKTKKKKKKYVSRLEVD